MEVERPRASEKQEHGMHATRIDDAGRVIDEVTGEEVEPVVTFKTWIVVLVSIRHEHAERNTNITRFYLAVMVYHSGQFLSWQISVG